MSQQVDTGRGRQVKKKAVESVDAVEAEAMAVAGTEDKRRSY